MPDKKDNLIACGNRFTPDTAREYGRRGGIKSGEVRRRKANFKKTFNVLLTAEIDNPEWQRQLEAVGLDCTLESALAMVMCKAALSGDTRAFELIGKFAGQTQKTENDEREQEVRIARAEIAKNEELKSGEIAEGESSNPFGQLTIEELRRLIDG